MNIPPASDRKRFIRERAVDLLPPLVIYYGLHLAGATDWVALLVAVVAAALRVVWVAARDRALNPFAGFTLLSFTLGFVLTFISGDPRFLLLKDVITISAVGIAFLVTAALGHRPLTLIVHQAWAPSHSVQIAQHYRTHPDVRHRHRVSSTVGGLTLLAFALLKTALIFLFPISVMVGLTPIMELAIAAGLIVWTTRYLSRAQPPLPGPVRGVDDHETDQHGATDNAGSESGRAAAPTQGVGTAGRRDIGVADCFDADEQTPPAAATHPKGTIEKGTRQ